MTYLRPHQARFLLSLAAAGGTKSRRDFGADRIPDETCAAHGWVTGYGQTVTITAAGRVALERKHPHLYAAALQSAAIPPAVHATPATAARIIAEARTSGKIQVFTHNMGGRA